MKKLIIFLAAALTITSAFAQRYGYNRPNRPVIVRPTPIYPASCSFDLEVRGFNANTWNFVQEFSRYSCAAAYDACEYERMVRPNSINYRCIESRVSRPNPIPVPPPTRNSCEYRIQDGRYTEADVFSASGFNACEQAESQCIRVLRIKKQRGEVSRRAICVKQSRPTPPPRRFTAQCTAQQYFSANRGSRPTEVRFTATGSGFSYDAARNAACNEAMRQCNNVSFGRFYCVEEN